MTETATVDRMTPRLGEGDPPEPRGLKIPKGLCAFFAFVLLAVVLNIYTPIGDYFNVEKIREFAGGLGVWGPVVILAGGILSPLVFLPRWPMAFMGGLLYGVVWGVLLAGVASTLGAWLHFALAKTLLAPWSDRLRRKYNVVSMSALPRDKMFLVLFFFRAFPLSNFVATNLLAGALKVPTGLYLAATFLGMIPSSIMYASWGKLMKKPSSSHYALAVISLVFILVGTWLAQKRFMPWVKTLRQPGKG